MKISNPLAVTLLLVVLATVGYDVRSHFDSELVDLKIKHNSAQRHWNTNFSQRAVFYHSPFRYEDDLRQIRSLISEKSLLLSDLATSYYAAALLPVYVANIHQHQSRNVSTLRAAVEAKRHACYLDKPNSRRFFFAALRRHHAQIKQPHLKIKYLLLNKDSLNRNLRRDCLAARSKILVLQLGQIGELKYEGEFLNLYRIKSAF